MSRKIKYLIKNVGILTIGNFSSKILVFLLVPLYTSVLTTTEYGTYDLLVSTVQLLFPILTANIADAVMRFGMDRSIPIKETAAIGMRYMIRSILFFAVGLTVVTIFQLFHTLKGYTLLVFFYYLFYTLNQYFIQLSKALENIRVMAVAGVLGTVSMLLLNIMLLLVFPCGLLGFFIANILSQAILTIYYIIRLKVWNYIKIGVKNKILEKEMLVYSVPLIATAIGWWINHAADKYVVALLCGMAANGILSVSYKIPNMISTLQNIFIQAWQVSAIREYKNNDADIFYKTTFIYLNLLLVFSCAFLILFVRPIASMLYAKDFYDAWKYVPFLVISSVVNASSGYIGSILSAEKNSLKMAKSAACGSAVNVVLNFLLVSMIGIQGATVATVISSIVIYAVRKRAVGKLINSRQYKNVMFSWVLLSFQACMEIYYSNNRIECLCILLLILIYRDPIKTIVSKILFKLNMKKI